MILLTEVAKKLQNIFNGIDSETSSYTRPVDFDFHVQNEGYHLDNVYDPNTKKNFIPVFIESLGGQYDAVPNLNRCTNSIAVTIYYPVRFRDSFYAMNEFLVKCFVAKMLNYGTTTGKCLSNISIATFGEIENKDFGSFKDWINTTWKKPIEVMEAYMSMTFTLYLTCSDAAFIYGNDVTFNLEFKVGATTYSEDLVWTSAGTGGENSPISQQLVDVDSYAKNVINITNYNKSIVAYVKNSSMWLKLLEKYNNSAMNDLTDLKLVKKYKIGTNTYTYTYNQVLLSLNENVSLGDLLSFTITFGDKK